MVRYGAHAFVWLGDWTTEAGNEAIFKAADTGFDFIEIPLLRPETFDAESHRRALEQAGIGAVCSLALPREVHMPDNPKGAKRFLGQVLEKLEALGSSYLAGCIGYSLGALTGAPPTQAERTADSRRHAPRGGRRRAAAGRHLGARGLQPLRDAPL